MEKGDFMKKFFTLVIVLSIAGIFVSGCKRDDSQQASPQASNKQQTADKQQDLNKQFAPDNPDFNVFDMHKVSRDLRHRIRLNNKTTKTGISFTVHLLDPKDNKWKEFGTGILKGPGDTEYIISKFAWNLKNYRYGAIQPRDKKTYRYSFEENDGNLYIYIYDK